MTGRVVSKRLSKKRQNGGGGAALVVQNIDSTQANNPN